MKTLIKKIIKFLFKPFIKRYYSLIYRISNLEIALDYLLKSPVFTFSDDIGFNGQKVRKQIFNDILKTVRFESIVETGTWVGNTCGYMSRVSGLPIYTCEVNDLFLSVAKMRLKAIPNINFELSDSCKFLEKLSKTDLTKKPVFFYLDAHWHENFPIKKEIDIISQNFQEFVLMIDDFEVPYEKGYGYYDYGKGNRLTYGDFADSFSKNMLTSYFPAFGPAIETGAKQGCIVLAKKGRLSDMLDRVSSLKKYK